MKRMSIALILAMIVGAAGAYAQLPPDAVHLGRVKIPETQKSHELDPVTLEIADPSLPTWEHDGVTYGSSKADSKEQFMKDPAKYAEAHKKQRWENNFVQSMSRIWCPVTDEISAGGGLIWNELGIEWESCCQFCNDTKSDEDFPRALRKLKERAATSYELTMGKYIDGASSPVEGAIDFGDGFPDEEGTTDVAAGGAAESCPPAWLEGVELKPTLGEGVGTIFINRCVECHRAGGPAPMSFMSLGEIRKWTKNMKAVLEARTMPPFPAGKGAYANSKRLTQEELDTLLAWIDAGYPPGDGEYNPGEVWGGEWGIGEPDQVFALGEHTLGEDMGEHVAEYTIQTDLDEDKYVVAAEVKPTDTFLIASIEAGPLGSYYPGAPITEYDDGEGFLLKKGEEVKVRVFYTKEKGWEEFDTDTQFGVKFSERPAGIVRKVQRLRVANDDFTIPAGKAGVELTAEYTLNADTQILSVTPIMRFRGKSINAKAVLPDGTEKELVSIGYWDPLWRFSYELCEPLEAPKGTKIIVSGTYDNSEDNNANPDPSADVTAGPGGELLEAWISHSPK